MVEVTFVINGKIVEPDSLKDVLDITFLKHTRERIEETLATVRCSRHGKQPKVIVKGRNLDNLHYEVSGCCEEFVMKVRNMLK